MSNSIGVELVGMNKVSEEWHDSFTLQCNANFARTLKVRRTSFRLSSLQLLTIDWHNHFHLPVVHCGTFPAERGDALLPVWSARSAGRGQDQIVAVMTQPHTLSLSLSFRWTLNMRGAPRCQ